MNIKVSKKMIPLIIFLSLLSFDSHSLCIHKNKVNARKGPGTNFKRLWHIDKFNPVKEVEIKGEWIKVEDYDQYTYWVYKSLVTKNFKCAVVTSESVNLRSGPGTTFKKYQGRKAYKYDKFKVVELKDDKWAKVTDSFNESYWISTDFLWIY